MNNRLVLAAVVVAPLVGAGAIAIAVLVGAWAVSISLERNAQAYEALAVAQFCAQPQPNSIHEADCDFFGRVLRTQAWLALSPPNSNAVGRGKDHDE